MRIYGFLRHCLRCFSKDRQTCLLLCKTLLPLVCVWTAYAFCLPSDLFKDTAYSTVVTDRNGRLLGAQIARDGQWRFPPADSVPARFGQALVLFEDKSFYRHQGVDPLALIRAAWQNWKSGRVVSGGSTISMQVIRMSRDKDRTLMQKGIEILLATRLELRYSKEEILQMYAAHAPFGGNVVGIEAASWRYFGHPAAELSWGEAAVLAVLPNAPSMIHPGKNREALRGKRNRILQRLLESGAIDSLACTLACEEDLPEEPLPLPRHAPHLCDYFYRFNPGQRIRTTIDLDLQTGVDEVCTRWNREFSRSGIQDLSAVVLSVEKAEVLAYVGNADPDRLRDGSYVDVLRSPRSTGSILKPLLYAALLQEGSILPRTLLPDIPLNINGFAPQNFDLQFYGAVPADEALARSLNVPAVHLLRRYGVPKFYELLKRAGMHTLTRPASDYGLSLILGGAEGSLLDMTSIYASMGAACMAEGDPKWELKTVRGEHSPSDRQSGTERKYPFTDPWALYYMLEALKEVNRPDEIDWKMIRSVRRIAWKTGTSFGFRDAWAIGVTPEYAVGVWAGNAQGQGCAGLSGARTSGPVMFDLFNLLPATTWFSPPASESVKAEVCRQSGFLRGPYCDDFDTVNLPVHGLRSDVCPYHLPVLLSADGNRRLHAGEPGGHVENLFILPPSIEWYYRQHHPEYRPLPSFQKDVTAAQDPFCPMQFIYPENGSVLYIPRQLDGSMKGVVFHLAHSSGNCRVFWHLDRQYIATTDRFHQLEICPEPGRHSVTAVDEQGNTVSVGIEVREGRLE